MAPLSFICMEPLHKFLPSGPPIGYNYGSNMKMEGLSYASFKD